MNPQQCPVCDWRTVERWPGLHACESCGHVAAWPRDDPSFYEQLYGRNYFYGEEYADYLADAELHRRNAKLHLSAVLDVIGKGRERGSLLEVGCAYGFFLREAEERGFEAHGIDISKEPVEYAVQRGLRADHATLNEFEPDRSYRVACMWDTLEHLPDPMEALQRLSQLVQPSGWLALSTGDMSSYVASVRGRRWRMIHPPTHLHYFTRDSIRRALDRSGFDLVSIEHYGQFRALSSIVRNLGALRGKDVHRLVRLLDVLPVIGRPVYTNMWDVMTVVAQRRDDSGVYSAH